MGEDEVHRKRPTQADVQILTGVSQTAVSQIFNNIDFTIPGDAQQRVLGSIDELGYAPNKMVLSLCTKKPTLLPVLFSSTYRKTLKYRLPSK